VKGEIILGNSADLVLFEYQKDIVIQATWIDGEKIF
jgi:N-acetylglucosamine-6-phosphate deacetylase